MNVITLIGLFLFIEVVIIVICLSILLFYYFLYLHYDRKSKSNQKYLRQLIVASLKNNQPIDEHQIFKPDIALKDLLIVLEAINRNFSTSHWFEIKQSILTPELMKKARDLTASSSWQDRDIGIRFLRLQPNINDEEIVIPLIDDTESLVRIQAALCAVQIGTKRAIKQVLKRMAKESSLSCYPYRDALIHGGQSVYRFVEEIFKEEGEETIRSACLDVLSTHVNENMVPFMARYLNSNVVKDQVTAVKILSNLPTKESIQNLLKFLKDNEWEVRAAAAHGLGQLKVKACLPELTQTLQDPVWQVRVEAGWALKQMGEEGKLILMSQDPDINYEAYQAAKYVMVMHGI